MFEAMDVYAHALALIASRRSRRPLRSPEALDQLFARLHRCTDAKEASATEDRIWDLWMYHPHRSAAETLELATQDIAARRFDIAETRLTILLKRLGDFAEAWHKRASLYYLLGDDERCVHDLCKVLELEPRHFAAVLHLAEILSGEGKHEAARFTFAAALTLNPHLQRAREMLSRS